MHFFHHVYMLLFCRAPCFSDSELWVCFHEKSTNLLLRTVPSKVSCARTTRQFAKGSKFRPARIRGTSPPLRTLRGWFKRTASSSRTRWTLWRSTFRRFKRKQGQRNVPNLRLRKHKLLRPLKRRRRVGSRELWRPATARPAVPCARKQLRNDIYRYTLEKSTFFSHIGLKPEGSPMSVEGQSQLKSFWGATSNRSIEVSWSLDSCKVRSAAGFMTCRFQAWEIAEKSFPAFLTASVWAEYMHQPFVS